MVLYFFLSLSYPFLLFLCWVSMVKQHFWEFSYPSESDSPLTLRSPLFFTRSTYLELSLNPQRWIINSITTSIFMYSVLLIQLDIRLQYIRAMITFLSVTGDLIKLWTLIYLIYQLYQKKINHLVSLKSQVIIFISYFIRYVVVTYLDFHSMYEMSLYVIFMKFIYLTLQTAILILIIHYKCTRDNSNELYQDTFRFKYIVFIAFIVHLFTFHFQFFYNLSFLLESIAMVPQIMIMVKYHCKNSRMLKYLAGVLLTKIIYVAGWMIFDDLGPFHRKFMVFEILGYLPLLRVLFAENKNEFKEQVLISTGRHGL